MGRARPSRFGEAPLLVAQGSGVEAGGAVRAHQWRRSVEETKEKPLTMVMEAVTAAAVVTAVVWAVTPRLTPATARLHSPFESAGPVAPVSSARQKGGKEPKMSRGMDFTYAKVRRISYKSCLLYSGVSGTPHCGSVGRRDMALGPPDDDFAVEPSRPGLGWA